MARRGRTRPRSKANTSVQLAQVVGLVLLLVMIILFRDKVAGTASVVLSGFDSPDIQVEETKEGTEKKTEESPYLGAEEHGFEPYKEPEMEMKK